MSEANAVFDLTSVQASDVVDLVVTHPATGAATSWKLQMAGPTHEATLKLQNDAARERLQEERAKEQARANGRKWKAPDVDPEREKAQSFGRVARRIVGWSPVTLNGEAFPFSAENAAKLMTDPRYAWVADQVLAFFAEDAAFFPKPAKA